ncbi:hypothetical protein LMANV2_490047 [Leptospira interrogans serovar Manilae]|uniref:Uncharacterized protein n=1 Tax=Leptospira interrogans serovar Manilae TaxID=214675 RepID=A0AAQ1P174_LEPIR|nr:hypothetical protein LMANV2_490047 [Leptospira interrogans serovar Manilae]
MGINVSYSIVPAYKPRKDQNSYPWKKGTPPGFYGGANTKVRNFETDWCFGIFRLSFESGSR